ncbi:hypothetical protein DSCO28_35930 [Desulfosarcina ovata subsp. sediminis]|uniref:Rubredoxin-like domain-containing protein n=1 Tax=Desulfosarcina ovata subsp. sediminis TaxID=885957 RepID=A0A5K7ZS34_9BACT|nr:DUF2231 domain-containing protein [Desulfosarcina ovata]BBO83027.1 hypothetical protein DSCO28_35930 [Desulfosarcina ovata subsp. sediminis]
MKKWKCTVCGYIHTGDEPPDKCPVCGAPKSRFIDISEPEEASAPEPAAAAETVPEETPAVESEAPAETVPEPESPFKDSRYRQLFEMMTRYHGHPISVHIPNGLLPVVVLFIFLAAIFNLKGMATAAIFNLGVVALAMPLVLFSGWVDWQNRFGGAMTNVFSVKIACGLIVTVTAWLLFIWLLVNPAVITTPQSARVAFFVINLIMLGAAATAGWYGGKLVFRE